MAGRSDVLLSTVSEVNEKVLPAITLKQRRPGRGDRDKTETKRNLDGSARRPADGQNAELQENEEAKGGEQAEEEEEEEEETHSPELDLCVLKPLEFDAAITDGQQCLALHHRRRFSRQRGSISLDGIVCLLICFPLFCCPQSPGRPNKKPPNILQMFFFFPFYFLFLSAAGCGGRLITYKR